MEGGTQLPPPAEMHGGTLLPPPSAGIEAEVEGEIQQPAAEMKGETQPVAAEMDGQTQPVAAEMDGESLPPPPLPACVSKVLDDDNLLTEILVRVGFPTSLVRAAAVCRRWLRLASNRAFLRWFRKLHPPRLLGFFRAQREYPYSVARFFPMLPQPPPPELAAFVSRPSLRLDPYDYVGEWVDMVGCWNGTVVTSLHVQHHCNQDEVQNEIIVLVHNPLSSERGLAIKPALHIQSQKSSFYSYRQLFYKEEGNAVSYIHVMVENTREGKTMVQVHTLGNGDAAWCPHLTLTMDYLIYARDTPRAVHVDNKIYMAGTRSIVVLDLTASSFSTIQLPQGVEFCITGTTMLSRADDASALYLIHARKLQLHIWLHKGGNWLLVDNICLREMCAPFFEDEPPDLIEINHVGNYKAEFLFLEVGRYTLYLDVKRRTLHKVYEMTEEDTSLGSIYPFMMIRPPIFPVLKDAPASNAT